MSLQVPTRKTSWRERWQTNHSEKPRMMYMREKPKIGAEEVSLMTMASRHRIFCLESESMDHSSDSDRWDADSPSPSKMGRILRCFDDPIVEDDSLIEIELPNGHCVGQTPNLLEMLSRSISRQKGIMELLSEINEMSEEENLIEIDISMGSIKC
uniref:Uncharacterized protein n=1 Tax=Nelumbo nucifera TaxID=4432 RepID=A0A822XQY5_NELNU|nr:TPA_asm: hypothetical protein HUJ06_022628 [Nelumbo nucifera]